MPEVASEDEQRSTVRDASPEVGQAHLRRPRVERAIADQPEHHRSRHERQGARSDERRTPLFDQYRAQQMRRAGSERQRAHDRADRHTPPDLEPARDHVHRRRIDSAQEHTGQEPRREPEREVVRDECRDVGERRQHRGCREQPPLVESLGEIEQGRRDRARDEAELDRDGQPRDLAAPEPEFVGERGSHGVGAEPHRNGTQRRQGDEPECPQPARWPCAGDRGSGCLTHRLPSQRLT